MAERCDKGCGGTEDVTKNSAFIDKAGEIQPYCMNHKRMDRGADFISSAQD